MIAIKPGPLSGKIEIGSARAAEIQFQSVKQLVHERLVANLDITSAEDYSPKRLSEELLPFVLEILAAEKIEMGDQALERLTAEMPREMFGTGPLERLLDDANISDILVNHAQEVYVERNGPLELSDVVFADDAHLLRIIRRIAAQVGRRIDESSPLVDARLIDGSRINAIIPPLALDGPKLSIRRFGKLFCTLDSLVENHTLTRPMAQFLNAAVKARKNMLISGGTGSGKTTMLNALSSCIPADQRIITIEDSAELILQHRHVARLETRPANSENTGAFSQRDLVRNSLRMRPDRIIVGEVRGPEALDMLQAMNTGHEGSLTTIHANNTADAISRLEMMVAMAGLELPHSVVAKYISSGISLIVHLSRLQGGARRVTRVTELSRSDEGAVFSDIFVYEQTGVDAQGHATGHVVHRNQARCIADFAEKGIVFDDSQAPMVVCPT